MCLQRDLLGQRPPQKRSQGQSKVWPPRDVLLHCPASVSYTSPTPRKYINLYPCCGCDEIHYTWSLRRNNDTCAVQTAQWRRVWLAMLRRVSWSHSHVFRETCLDNYVPDVASLLICAPVRPVSFLVHVEKWKVNWATVPNRPNWEQLRTPSLTSWLTTQLRDR